MRSVSRRLGLLLLVASIGCGGPSTGLENGGTAAGQPPEVTASSFRDVERAYWRMEPEDPARIAWRDALIRHVATDSTEILARADYDEVVQQLGRLVSFLTPADVGDERVPEDVAPLALFIVEHGARRGDEGRVMGALLLLAAIGDAPAERRTERERIAAWGREARARVENPIELYRDLIQIWEQHEQLAPSPEALQMLARLYVEQRDSLMAAFGPEGERSPAPGQLSFHDLRIAPLLIQRAPLDVAAVYLRHGDLARAVEHVRRMGQPGGLEWRLAEILERAQDNNANGAEALGELAQGFLRARPDISQAICRIGARRFPQDSRFPLCLARVAGEQHDPITATLYYAEAVRLAPNDRDIYDEALGKLDEMMEEGLLEADVAVSRAIVGHALLMLEERTTRWPAAAPSVSQADLLVQMGRAEMNAGNVQEARERLEASLELRESRDGHMQLGLLLERSGHPDEAARHYRRALDMTPQQDAEGVAERAQLIEHLGDAFRRSGDERQATRLYRQALTMWDQLLPEVRGPQRATIEARRGVLLSRAGDTAAAEAAFTSAMEAAPNQREPYATILAHLVTTSSNARLAQDVLRRAQFQISLEPEWKVYFALWVQAIAARASVELEGDVAHLLGDLSRGEAWSARLASFGRGELAYPALVEAAENGTQRAEAAFYEGARRLADGEVEAAQRLFTRVLESGLVSAPEYVMAQELLEALPPRRGAVAEQAPAR